MKKFIQYYYLIIIINIIIIILLLYCYIYSVLYYSRVTWNILPLQDGALLICSVDDTTASVIKCSSAVKPAGGIVQLAKASSASSLYHALQPNGVGPAAFVFYNYGVLRKYRQMADQTSYARLSRPRGFHELQPSIRRALREKSSQKPQVDAWTWGFSPLR